MMTMMKGHLFTVVDDVTQSVIRVENSAVRRLEVMYDDRATAVR